MLQITDPDRERQERIRAVEPPSARSATPRIDIVDVLKGVAIVLVVFGHAMQRGLPDYVENPVWRIVYSFHMPLFMLLSGFVIGNRTAGYGGRWLWRRALALLVPFFLWHAIYYYASALPFAGLRPFIDYSMPWHRYMWFGVLQPGNGLWYLWVLFLCCVVVAVTEPIAKRIGSWSLVLGWALVLLVPTPLFGLAALKWYFVFFAIGFALRSPVDRLTRPVPGWLVAVPLLGFPLASAVCLRMLPVAEPALTLSRFSLAFFTAKLIWALLGIGFTWALARAASRWSSMVVFKRLGVVTIEIYVCHLLFLQSGVGSGWVDVATTTVYALALAVAVSVPLDYWRPTRAMLFGRWWSKSPYGPAFWRGDAGE